jgi:CoA:oxalate CoA-transferase
MGSGQAFKSSAEKPLANLKVLDFTQILAGPFCTALLADLGAEVVKVEPPKGDEYRRIGPFRNGQSALFLLVNRGKKSICLDLKSDDGREAVRALVRDVDIVVENFRPGVAARLGIDYPTLSALNDRLVYASISGFGQSGPDADRPSYDLIAQASSGLMHMTGEPDGQPMKVGESIGDLSAGLFASWALLARLYERERTGQGGYVDVAMFDALFSLMPTAIAQWMFGETSPERVGNRHPLSTPFGSFQASDGHFIIAVLNDGQFKALCSAMGRADLFKDERYASDELRTLNEAELREIIESWSTSFSVVEVVDQLTKAQVPSSPIQTMEQAIESAQVAARGLLTRHHHPLAGDVPAMEQPVQFDGVPRGDVQPAPVLGVHTREVLTGLSDLDVTVLQRLCTKQEGTA